MPYTLMKGWVWVLIGVLLGLVIGWLLRSIAAKRQVARARKHHVDAAALARMRDRIEVLEPIAAERDRLKIQLDECRAQVATPVAAPAEPQGLLSAGGASAPESTTATPAEPPAAAVLAPDVSEAVAVLGSAVKLDDLKVVEGIGPKIESLCHAIGIHTWLDLSTTEVSLLRTMLADAGSRFKTHDPSTWPQQAALLAAGRWHDFKAFTDGLRGGRAIH